MTDNCAQSQFCFMFLQNQNSEHLRQVYLLRSKVRFNFTGSVTVCYTDNGILDYKVAVSMVDRQ